MRTCLPTWTLLASALFTFVPNAFAQAVDWQAQANLRVRHEHVGDDAFARSADATTARLRAGLHAAFGDGWQGLIEGEAITASGDFNDGRNARTGLPGVADAHGLQLNQAWLRRTAGPVVATAGRQRLQLANQRWIGNSGWRQNEQTFDGFDIDARVATSLSLHYAWLQRVHRVSGDDALDPLARERRLDSHYLELAWSRGAWQLAPFALLHRDRDLATASSATWGARAAWSHLRDGHGCRVEAEAARQRDAGANPLSFTHAYWRLEPSCAMGGHVLRAGWEHLGGNGVHALQAPLGTLHAFNGWADKFNATPPDGLDDRYLGAGGKAGRAKALDWQLAWHDFRADTGAGRLGSEWDASLGFPLAPGTTGLLKLADYRADRYARDTLKLWLQLEWTH
jgi:hypothetical protein